VGYNTSPKLVEQNETLLDSILTAVNAGQEKRFTVRAPANISAEQYRLRRVLAACDAHKLACNGKFAGLGQRVSLRIDHELDQLVVRPAGGVSIEEFRPSEKDAIDFLIDAKGSLVMIEFYPSPSFDRERLHAEGLRNGWAIVLATEDIAEDGKRTYAAERVEEVAKPSGFAALGGV
jgi:hypothetical protein